ncbi:allantoate amidohydrolase [Micropruina sp.]|uniref:allantoate amidohydrolase n=1 Tax=Micropruina sp. TaxID=2737536 RepID=UPI0039E44518
MRSEAYGPSATSARLQAAVFEAAGRRAYDRCDELAAITEVRGRIQRLHLTPQHRMANNLVGQWMRGAGLATRIDAAGNLVGRIEGREARLPAVVLGSHIDTVPDAGRYDGPLGVMIAIETVELLREVMPMMPCALEVYAFSDEEGTRFGSALLGSNPVAGNWKPEWLDQTDQRGTTLRQAFRDFGLDPNRVTEAALRPEQVVAYLEAHIEQGPLLEAMGRPLGVVTSIAGARRFALTVTGEARHSGGTPYDRRKDALVGASQAVLAIESIAKRRGIIATVGAMHAYPGAVNVVPGRAEFSLDLRAETDRERDDGWAEILDTVTSNCRLRNLQFSWVEEHRARAVTCAPDLMAAVEAAISRVDRLGEVPSLYSRAGHDAMVMADLTDIGMLFVRCEDGISHAPTEAVTMSDVRLAVEAFTAAVRSVLTGERRPHA